MERVENHMLVEARQQFIMERARELMEVDDPDEDAQRQYLLDCIDANDVVRTFLDAFGFGSIEDLADFVDSADVDDLADLLHDLEEAE